MPSTYSTSLRLELIGNGDQAGNWGNTTNTNLGTLIEQAITGVQSIAMSDANYTLVSGNGVADEARNAVVIMTGTLTATRNVVVPTAEKFYAFRNATTGGQSILVKTSAGTGVTLANGFTQLMYCDGTNVVAASVAYNVTTGSIGDITATSAVISGSSSGDLVRITQTGTGNALVVEDSANPDATPFVVDASGKVGVGTGSPAVKFSISANDAMLIPVGTTAERPTGATGYLRYNTTTGGFEGHNGTAWGSIGGGATGGGSDQIFYLNGQTVTTSYSIPSAQNAGTFGSITINSGATVTVPSGSTWTVV